MSTSNQANEGLYVLDMHIKLRYMGMRKTLKVYFFVIQVSLYSLNSQLSFDTLQLVFSMQKWSNGKNCAFLITNWPLQVKNVKSEVAPDL